MNYSELLNSYIDEGINAKDEDFLFSELAENPSLRNELKQLIDIEKAANKDFAAFIPPVESTAGIFSTLGISTTAAVVSAATVSNMSFWAKYGSMLLTNFVSIILTGIISFFIWNSISDENNFNAHSKNSHNSQEQFIKIEPDNNFVKSSKGIPFVNNSETIVKTNISKTDLENKNILKNSTANITDEVNYNDDLNKGAEETLISSNIFIQSDEIKKLNKEILFSSNEFTNIIEKNKFSTSMQKIPVAEFQLFQIHFNLFEKNDLSVVMSGSETWSLKKETVERSSSPFMKNGNLLLLYNINKKLSLGVDIRQEFFFQEYTGSDEKGNLYLFEQNTNYPAIGFVGKYSIFENNYFKPFAQVYLGGNKVGQIGRLLLGLELLPLSDYGFILGLEGSTLRYFHEKNVFYSNKVGAYYGIIIRL